MLFPAEPIGRCIYCRSTSPPLTDEHVVPYALDGDYVLKEATCGDCQKATSKFEREVLRNGLAQARAVLGLSTRHPKKRPVYGILRIDRGQKAETLIAPLKETGAMVPLFTFPSPAFITRHPYAGGIQPTAIWAARVGGKPFGEISELRGIRTIRGTTHYGPVQLAACVTKVQDFHLRP